MGPLPSRRQTYRNAAVMLEAAVIRVADLSVADSERGNPYRGELEDGLGYFVDEWRTADGDAVIVAEASH